MKPLAIDLFCGLGGWTEGLLDAGYRVVGFDIERHAYGSEKYPAQLVLQDVLTIHGSQFKGADLIVASPPCQEYSYMAMPWSRAKAIAADYRAGRRDVKKLTALFDACFRIQREASEAAGRWIPMVVENVRGAQPWVGRARVNYGSFYLWGDTPALMPAPHKAVKVPMGKGWRHPDHPDHRPGLSFNGLAERATKNEGGSWFAIGSPGQKVTGANPVHEATKTIAHVNKRDGHGHRRHLTNQAEHDAVKNGGDWFGSETPSAQRRHSHGSSARKAASARIAKIPPRLSRWIAQFYLPEQREALCG